MWLDVLLDPLALVPQTPVYLHAGHDDVSPCERGSQTLHRLDTHRADLHLFLAARLRTKQFFFIFNFFLVLRISYA